MSARALGGGELAGEKLVRFVYLDESGTGNPKEEPFLVVAGVMVHADRQWKRVENYLKEMADKFATPDDRPEFCFHANQMFTGGKATFREKYPMPKRHAALAELCSIPEKFSLPVFMYAINRAAYSARRPGLSANELLTEELMHASIACATGVEEFMRQHADADEVATLVYEQNSDKNEAIRAYHHLFRSDFVQHALSQMEAKRLTRFERIIESALFSGKTDSSLLQIADTCAYIFARHLRGAGLEDRFYMPIRRQLMFGPSSLMREPV